MCDFKAASYRLVTVVESTDGKAERRTLNVIETENVGDKISGRVSDYMAAVESGVEQGIREFGEPLNFGECKVNWDTEKGVSARFDPGLILDFPRVELKTDLGSLEVRACLTVCVGEMKSKLWTRCNTQYDWEHLSNEQVDLLHAFFESISQKINDAFRELYEQDFGAVVGESVRLEEYGRIHVYAIDCGGEGVSDELEKVYLDKRGNRAKSKTLESDELAPILNELSKLYPHRENVSGPAATANYILRDNEKFFPFRASNLASSIFIQSRDEIDAYLYGIVDANIEKRPDDHSANKTDPNGSGTTAELGLFFASAF